ncbi:lysis protein [Hafnia alvei]|jgi:prophage endopeptidase|uniref:lysis protein n=1 Tax=Hafnia alvei TaxID=569 RepID=UPI0010341E4A|nr:lysis protein [Hafnia alvei]TBL90059.1 lysis protein [Hafnia alvei]
MSKINLTLIFIIIIAVLAFLTDRYHSNATEYKKQRDDKVYELNTANATITDMTIRQRDVAKLDAKYTKELDDAQKTISDLRRDVDSGAKRMRVAATCNDMRKTTGTASMDDAASPRLTDAAQRDYFTLRERIESITKQLTGLQEYVHSQCLE